jgi:hypothetical protein
MYCRPGQYKCPLAYNDYVYYPDSPRPTLGTVSLPTILSLQVSHRFRRQPHSEAYIRV